MSVSFPHKTIAAVGVPSAPVVEVVVRQCVGNGTVWAPDNASLYFTATNGAQNTINRVDADNLAVAALPTDYQSNLIAGSDGLLYAVGAKRAAVEQVTYNGTALAKAAVADLSLATNSTATFTGIVPGAPLTVATAPVQPVFSRALGRRRYELTDHLGNVRAVVGDRLYSSTSANGTVVYRPELLSYNDYYPFGMNIKSLSGNSSEYRYGYNGKEKDDKGEWGITHYDYGFRIYNPALARFLSVDPLTASYPWNSTYAFAENDVIRSVDLDGLEKSIVIFSPYNRSRIDGLLKQSNYRKIIDILEYTTTHTWVDNEGKPSDYYSRINPDSQIPKDKSSVWSNFQDNPALKEKYGNIENGAGWISISFYNPETEKNEFLGYIPIAKINEHPELTLYRKSDSFWSVKPTNNAKEAAWEFLNRVAPGFGQDIIEKFLKIEKPFQFDPNEVLESKAKFVIKTRLRTLGPNSMFIMPLLKDDKAVGYWKLEYQIEENGSEKWIETNNLFENNELKQNVIL